MNATVSVCGANVSDLWQLKARVCSTKFHSLEVFVLVAIILSMITLWTISGNVLVLLALCRYRNLRTMSNCLIGNLAFSDLLLAVTVLPISTGHDLLGYWVFGKPVCTLWLCVDVLYCTASIWGLCTVAFDRYLATVYPVWYHDQRSVRKAVGCIVFVWIFSIIISLAPFIGWRQMIPKFFTFNPTIRRHECILFTSSSYVLYSAMGSFVVPAVLMTFMYIRIFAVLHGQSRGLKKVTLTSTSPSYKGNGYPIIRVSTEEETNGVVRDFTTTTLMSATAESSSNLEDNEETDGKVDNDKLMRLQLASSPLLAGSDVSMKLEDSPGDQQSWISKSNATSPSVSKRSNSFAVATDVNRERNAGRSLLSAIDLDRRNSHTEAIQRTIPDMGNMSANILELRLSPACHRSKSASALSSGEEIERLRTPTIPRRSLPCNITIFRRNSHMTMSSKRRFELREQRATKRMVLIMACFCICWMPFLFMYVLRSVCAKCIMNKHVVAAIIWLGYVNSSLNPILYTLFNDDFRNAFKKLLGFKPLKDKGSSRGW